MVVSVPDEHITNALKLFVVVSVPDEQMPHRSWGNSDGSKLFLQDDREKHNNKVEQYMFISSSILCIFYLFSQTFNEYLPCGKY